MTGELAALAGAAGAGAALECPPSQPPQNIHHGKLELAAAGAGAAAARGGSEDPLEVRGGVGGAEGLAVAAGSPNFTAGGVVTLGRGAAGAL